MASRRQNLDAIIAALDKANAEKARFEGPIPETPDTQEALKILNAPSQEQCHRILKTKLPLALRQWAMMKMGENIGLYIEEGLRYFMTLVLVRRTIEEERDPSEILLKIPFIIPLKFRRRPLFPVNPIDALNEYGDVLDRVKDILKKTKRNPITRIMTFVDKLPTTRGKAEQYCSMKASHIALDHLARKYKLPIGAEALKKHLRFGRSPEKIMERIIRDFEQRSSYPRKPVKPPL